jgi:hypothetical protein
MHRGGKVEERCWKSGDWACVRVVHETCARFKINLCHSGAAKGRHSPGRMKYGLKSSESPSASIVDRVAISHIPFSAARLLSMYLLEMSGRKMSEAEM